MEKYVCIQTLYRHYGHDTVVIFKKGNVYSGWVKGYFRQDVFFIDENGDKEDFYREDSFGNVKTLADFLIPLAEYRDKQIEEILND